MYAATNPNHCGRRDFLRLLGWGAGGAVVLGGLSACGGGASTAGPGGAGFRGEAAIAHLESIINAAPVLVAAGLGYFQDEGLDLDLVSFPGGTDTIRGVASGIPFGMPATLPGLIAYQKGQRDLRIIGGAVREPLVNFLVPADSEIRSIDDLRGKRIAVSQPGSITTYFATRIVTERGLVPGQTVEILNVGGPPDAWTAAQQGVADVAWSALPISQRLIDEGKARLLFECKDHVRNWSDNTYWTTQSVIDDTPEILQAWLRAVQRAITAITTDLDAAGPAYARGAGLADDLARSALEQAGSAFSLEIDMPGMEENIRAGSELGQLDPAALDLERLIVTDFVDTL
jgi:NitT/TauT family transport system substrate-binding protein